LKWAETADGKIAGAGGARRQISSAISSQAVHDLRARCDAIAVGVNTIITDDPELTARGSAPLRVPRRVIFDSSLRIPLTSKVVQTARTAKTIVFTIIKPGDRIRRLEDLGVHVEQAEPTAIGRLSLKSVLNKLDDVTHLLVEPGPTLAAAFFEENIADRLWVFRSQDRLDDATAPPAAAIPENFKKGGELQLGNDVLTEYLNTRSPVFYALAESADLILSSPLTASRINRQ
jgi:diaminohydroxyphosphoribosylaminopyrimidine deaminase/5-amino-6-(5-phosphoribosylamino)uracil reductase